VLYGLPIHLLVIAEKRRGRPKAQCDGVGDVESSINSKPLRPSYWSGETVFFGMTAFLPM
jgi:hypothetical protein